MGISFLTTKNMPNSQFKLSTIDKKTIEVNEAFESNLSKVTSAYTDVKNSFTTYATELNTLINNNKKYFDNASLTKLENLVKNAKTQASYCEARAKAIKQLAQKDTKQIKEEAQKAAWKKAIEALLSDPGLSAASKAALEALMSTL